MAKLDLLKGTLPLLVLSVLRKDELYGYEIAQRIRERSGELFAPSEGSLYPTLHRLERDGALTATWRASEKGPRRRYYALTPSGERLFGDASREWDAVSPASAGWPGPPPWLRPRERYLGARRLLPIERRAELIEEINAHLNDAVAERLEARRHAGRRGDARTDAPRFAERSRARSRSTRAVGLAAPCRGGRGCPHGRRPMDLRLPARLADVAPGCLLPSPPSCSGTLATRLFETGWTVQFTDQGWNTLITSGAFGSSGSTSPDARCPER